MKIPSFIPSSGLFLLFSVVLLLACGVARGQSALDGFDPNANDTIRVVVVQPDGKILIGGDFTTLAPNGGASVTRNRIARLNPDGTLDTAFNPNANGSVRSIAVQADGEILAGGLFTTIGGQTRNRIARLDPVTGLADSFDPNASSSVLAIAVQADGKLLVGGQFTTIGGQGRNRIARLDPATGLADSFNPGASSVVLSIALQRDGKILAGGFFTNIGGQPRNRIARLDPVTGLADSFNPNSNGEVQSIAVQPDGKILAAGVFGGVNSIGGQTRNRIARLDPATGLADSFNPNASGVIYSITIQPDGKILAGGEFGTIGGQTRHFIARLDPATGLADSFNPDANDFVFAIAVQPDGKILAGGDFNGASSIGGATRNRIARLESGGSADRTLDLNIVGDHAGTIAVQPDGKVLIGGDFSSVLGLFRRDIARLNADGTVDTAFTPSPNPSIFGVLPIAVQADGKILAGGSFTTIGGQTRNKIARLDPTTGLADSFNPNANNTVTVIAVQPDGKILVGGDFSTIGGQTRNHIARLDPTTGLADSFNPNSIGTVQSIAIQPDGKVLAGGSFSTIGGQTRNNMARLDATTGLADSFNPNPNGEVRSIIVQPDGNILVGGGFTTMGLLTRNRVARLNATTGLADSFNPNVNNLVLSVALQADGKVLIGGLFSNVGGQARNRIARLDATTGLADSFDPNANSNVYSIAVQADGKVMAAGLFTSMGGQARNFFARLNNDTPALQNLIVTRNVVVWTRAGSSPQFNRVTFEDSINNVNYNFLGNATASGDDWVLTGLNLSIDQNLYIRARGYYSSGYQNGAESIGESVRNAFITLPPPPTQVVSRKIHGGTPRDINLPLSGTSGIECRSGGATNDYEVIFTFPSPVTFNAADVLVGSGSVSGTSGNGTSAITVNLTGVTNAQRITVTLFGVTDGTSAGDLSVQMGVLTGDTGGNGSVNASDVSQTKSRIGQAVDASNFRSDINANGTFNASDVSQVKSNLGTALP